MIQPPSMMQDDRILGPSSPTIVRVKKPYFLILCVKWVVRKKSTKSPALPRSDNSFWYQPGFVGDKPMSFRLVHLEL